MPCVNLLDAAKSGTPCRSLSLQCCDQLRKMRYFHSLQVLDSKRAQEREAGLGPTLAIACRASEGLILERNCKLAMPCVLADVGAAKMKMSNLSEHCKPVCQRRCLPCVQGDAVLAVLTLSLRCRRNFPEEQVRCRVLHKFAWTESGNRSPKSTLAGARRSLCHICSAMPTVENAEKEKSLSCMQCNANANAKKQCMLAKQPAERRLRK